MCKPCIYPNIMHTEVIQYNMQWSATTPKVLFFFFFWWYGASAIQAPVYELLLEKQ